MPFKKGNQFNKGKKASFETRKKMSDSAKKSGTGKWMKGKIPTDATKLKLSLAAKGKPFSGTQSNWKGKKHRPESKQKMSEAHRGERSYFWAGGISFEPYSIDWTKTLRRSIRERDGYQCQLCSMMQEDEAFAVHHIDYDKKNCSPDNLTTLCRRCHARTNTNRDYWKKYFSEKK